MVSEKARNNVAFVRKRETKKGRRVSGFYDPWSGRKIMTWVLK
jgi:hypothetical protein